MRGLGVQGFRGLGFGGLGFRGLGFRGLRVQGCRDLDFLRSEKSLSPRLGVWGILD